MLRSTMAAKASYSAAILQLFLVVLVFQCSSIQVGADINATIIVDASAASGRPIPETLFGIFFEEINHAGAGGLWAELVSNRGFEAGGPNTPSHVEPWTIIGDNSSIIVRTDGTSLFERNKVALQLEVLCNAEGDNICPADGVGVYNPGFYGMNIEQGKTYKVVFYVRSTGAVNLSVSFAGSNGEGNLASTNIIAPASDVSNWTKMETLLVAVATNSNSRLQLTTTTKGTIWLDQVSAMPVDTYKGHGFRSDLYEMLANLKPRFVRFPGGCYVEGKWLKNAFRWKETVGPWEERPGHNGYWDYWTDDGLGYFELLQLAEDLGALPVWVFNNGISHHDEINTTNILPFVQEALDGIEFARGDPTSKWGSIRASMGHPDPFNLSYVAVGNEDCGKVNYRGNYMKFYYAIKSAYRDIQIISNCDASHQALDHPADLYDYHVYTRADNMFHGATEFDHASRVGPKAFVSEYAVRGLDAGNGSLYAAIAEAGFLIGLEKNSDVVQMVCYAPLFVNTNNRKWMPDAIVFNSNQLYGTPSYWVQQFFLESSGATLLNISLQTAPSNSLAASTITWQSPVDKKNYVRVKVVNFGGNIVNIKIFFEGFYPKLQLFGSTKTLLTSANRMDENSFSNPKKVVPVQSSFQSDGKEVNVILPPVSLSSFDFVKETGSLN